MKRHAIAMAVATVLSLLASACGPTGEPAQAASKATPASGGCPSLGSLSETFDASGTPLVFDFRHPAGFEVRSAKAIDDFGYQIDLAQASGGASPATISVLQVAAPSDSPTPADIPTPEQVERSPALQAMAEMLPKPAETTDFGGHQVATFRAVTDTKVVYKFNLPDGDGYRTVDVHFYPPAGPGNCVAMMQDLATQWIGQLVPRQAVDAERL